jgi:hypothetical protein
VGSKERRAEGHLQERYSWRLQTLVNHRGGSAVLRGAIKDPDPERHRWGCLQLGEAHEKAFEAALQAAGREARFLSTDMERAFFEGTVAEFGTIRNEVNSIRMLDRLQQWAAELNKYAELVKVAQPEVPDGSTTGRVLADLEAGIVRRERVAFDLNHCASNIHYVLKVTEAALKDSPYYGEIMKFGSDLLVSTQAWQAELDKRCPPAR